MKFFRIFKYFINKSVLSIKPEKKTKKKEIWPIRVTNDGMVYVDLKNCDQVGLAKRILKTHF